MGNSLGSGRATMLVLSRLTLCAEGARREYARLPEVGWLRSPCFHASIGFYIFNAKIKEGWRTELHCI